MNFLSLLLLLLVSAVFPVLDALAVDKPARRTVPTVESLPPPAAAGPLRILLVDEDLSDNNNTPGDKRLSPSDRVFRQLVADAAFGNPVPQVLNGGRIGVPAGNVVDGSGFSEVSAVARHRA